MKRRLSEEEIYEIYLEIEKELDLFNKIIDDNFFWKLIRSEVYSKILADFKLLKYELNKRTLKTQQFLRVLKIIKNSLFNSTFRDKKQVDVLFLENPRKVKQTDGKYLDPFTYHYIENYAKNNNSFEIVDLGYNGVHFEIADNKRRFSDSIYYDFICRIKDKFLKQSFTKDEKIIIQDIETAIFDKFGIKLSIKSLIQQKLLKFKYQYNKFNKLFKIKKPKEVYLVCYYGKEGMIFAAQLNGIKVIEFQHGVMGKYQLNYSFPKEIKVPYFPDKLLMFGKFWSDYTALPKDQLKIEYIGYEYLRNKLHKYKNIEKQKKVLVLSQPGNTNDLIPTAIVLAKNNPEYKVIYRLHPKEIHNWQELYPNLKDASDKLKNFQVDNCWLDLYTEISKSEFVMGVYSAALFESIVLGSKLILVNSYGIDYMQYFIDKELVVKIEPCMNVYLKELELIKSIDIDYIYERTK